MNDAQSPRILIIRLSAIGDVVFASPLVRAVRARYPNAYIAWLAEPGPGTLLQYHPALDDVITWPKAPWLALWKARRYRELWRAIRLFRAELRNRRFDIVFDVQGLLKSAVLAWLTGAPRRVGFRSKEGNRWFLTELLDKRVDARRIGSEYLGFAEDVGLSVASFAMEIGLSEGDRVLAGEERCAGPYAVFCPFTTRPQKHWVEAHWLALARQIKSLLGLRIVILGGPTDQIAADRMVAALPDGAVESRAGTLSLRASAALIAGADLVIGVDTGLTHMGIAFERPTVALFGSTLPYTETTQVQARVISLNVDCAPCRRRPTCGGSFHCMGEIRPEQVLDVAKAVRAAR